MCVLDIASTSAVVLIRPVHGHACTLHTQTYVYVVDLDICGRSRAAAADRSTASSYIPAVSQRFHKRGAGERPKTHGAVAAGRFQSTDMIQFQYKQRRHHLFKKKKTWIVFSHSNKTKKIFSAIITSIFLFLFEILKRSVRISIARWHCCMAPPACTRTRTQLCQWGIDQL